MFPRIPCFLGLLCVVIASSCRTPAEATCKGTELRLAAPGKLTVAADYSYPPFAFRGTDGDLAGYEVELVEAVAKSMKLEATFVNRGAGSLVPGLLAHRHDLAASGLRAGADIEAQTCVSEPYLDADLGVLVPKANPQQIDAVDDLEGMTVAVLDGSQAERWTLERLGRTTVASLPATDDLLTALRQDRADAVVADLPFARFTQKNSTDFAVVAVANTEEGYAFLAAPDNAPLMRGINDALGRLRTNGTLRKLEKKWFGG